jgi:hypothetical protein
MKGGRGLHTSGTLLYLCRLRLLREQGTVSVRTLRSIGSRREMSLDLGILRGEVCPFVKRKGQWHDWTVRAGGQEGRAD